MTQSRESLYELLEDRKSVDALFFMRLNEKIGRDEIAESAIEHLTNLDLAKVEGGKVMLTPSGKQFADVLYAISSALKQ